MRRRAGSPLLTSLFTLSLFFAGWEMPPLWANDTEESISEISPLTRTGDAGHSAIPDFYGSLELRHSNAYYYEPRGLPGQESPDLRVQLQAGAILYGGLMDTFVTTGAIRYPGSQRVFQIRPEASIDLYPVRGPVIHIRQYHRLKLPFEKRDEYLRSYDSFWDERTDSDGSVYTIGLNPWAEWPVASSFGQTVLKGGFDVFSFMYSRAVYKETPPDAVTDQPQGEDSKPLIGSKQFLSADFQPSDLKRIKVRATLYYHSRYYPVYELKPSGIQDHYAAERSSGYRLRTSLTISQRTTLINDFYHYFSGFFEARRYGSERRFQNVIRLVTLL